MGDLYLVTGAGGFLGNVIIADLLGMGKRVRALLMPDEKSLLADSVEIVYGDVCDRESLTGFFENPEGLDLVVIHCAGIVSIASKYDSRVYKVNVGGTRNIVDMCRENCVKKLVYVSSVHAIPERPKGETTYETDSFDPNEVVGLYAKTKSEATAYVLEAAKKGLNASVVHPSGITGPYDNGRGYLTTLIIHYCKRKLTSAIKGGFDFVDVRDVSKGVIACTEKGAAGECYILSNRYFTIVQLLEYLHELTGQRRMKSILPLWFAMGTATLSEIYYKIIKQPPLFTKYSIYTLSTNAIYSHEKATRELGYTTRDMRDTLMDTVSWLKSKGRL